MTVKELKELLNTAPDEMPVMLIIEDHLKPGMFAFTDACACDTGVTELGPGEDGTCGGEKIFLVARHGSGVTDEEIESGEVIAPELN